MTRNPKNPKDYINKHPKQRAAEKMDLILEFIVQFNYSTRKILLRRLGLNTDSHHQYFKSMEDKKILRRTKAFSIRSDIYLLTALGKELALEKSLGGIINYCIDVNKINHSNLRHDLSVQKMVTKLLLEDGFKQFTSENYIDPLVFNDKKKPDALLTNDSEQLMLEVELTAKSDRRIFKAFTAHADGLLRNSYNKVLYVFHSDTLRKYYQVRFNQLDWPQFEQNEKGLWVKNPQAFIADEHPSLRDKFSFVTEETLLEDF